MTMGADKEQEKAPGSGNPLRRGIAGSRPQPGAKPTLMHPGGASQFRQAGGWKQLQKMRERYWQRNYLCQEYLPKPAEIRLNSQLMEQVIMTYLPMVFGQNSREFQAITISLEKQEMQLRIKEQKEFILNLPETPQKSEKKYLNCKENATKAGISSATIRNKYTTCKKTAPQIVELNKAVPNNTRRLSSGSQPVRII